MSLVDKQNKILRQRFPDINSVYDNYKISVYKFNVLLERRLLPVQNKHERKSSLHITYDRKLKQSPTNSKRF